MTKPKLVNNSLTSRFLLSAVQSTTDVLEKVSMFYRKKTLSPFQPHESLVDSLMHLMVCTQPDIAFAVDMMNR